jgi:hypothetical protein
MLTDGERTLYRNFNFGVIRWKKYCW